MSPLDEETFSVSTTDQRCLSRLTIESLMVAPVGTKMVLLVNAETDDKLLDGRGAHLSRSQDNVVRGWLFSLAAPLVTP